MHARLWVCLVVWILAIGVQHGCGKDSSCRINDDCLATEYCLARRCTKKCTDDLDCAPNQCQKRDGVCIPSTCRPLAETRCFQGNLHYYDSCGVQGTQAELCPNGCELDRCKKAAPITCGDGTCDPLTEGCGTCPRDCPCAAGHRCDNNQCQAGNPCKVDTDCPQGQTCLVATGKCQTQQTDCGDGTCDTAKGENCATCAKDCPCKDAETCDNGTCGAAKSCRLESDCPALHNCLEGKCIAHCGNGRCEPQENCTTCPKDCACSDGKECRNDQCTAPCGDGTCDAAKGENCTTCPKDCPCPNGQSCQNASCQTSCPKGLADLWTCTGTQLERCGPSTNYQPQKQPCPNGCLNQNCCACLPGATRCNGNDIEGCNSNCTGWERKRSCGNGQICDTKSGDCRCETTCKVDDHQCKGNTRIVCVYSSASKCYFWKDSQTQFQCGQGDYKDKKYCVNGTCCNTSNCR